MGLDRRGYVSSSKPRKGAAKELDRAEAQGGAASNSSEANADGCELYNIWQRQAREEMRTWVQKEREYRRNLQGKLLQKAAADAQDALESRKRLMLGTGAGRGREIDAPLLHTTARPVIWGSALYRGLWAKAAKINENSWVDASLDPCLPTLMTLPKPRRLEVKLGVKLLVATVY